MEPAASDVPPAKKGGTKPNCQLKTFMTKTILNLRNSFPIGDVTYIIFGWINKITNRGKTYLQTNLRLHPEREVNTPCYLLSV